MKHGSFALNFHCGPKTFLRESMSDLKSHWIPLRFFGGDENLSTPWLGFIYTYLFKILGPS